MLKFLRKYNKWILVFGGSLLMVAFLAPQAIQQCGFNPANRAYARIDGTKITERDYDRARRQFSALEQYFPVAVSPVDAENKVVHWMLLTHAADEAGFVGESADGYDWMTGELAQTLAQQAVIGQWRQQWGQALGFVLNQPQYLQQFRTQVEEATQAITRTFEQRHDQFAANMRLAPTELDEALSKTRGIWRMLDAYTSAARLSEPRAQSYSDTQRDEAYIDAAFITPDAVIDEVPEPTDEQIAEQFAAYDDVRPGEGEYGVGYLLPERVKLAWMTLDRAAIEAAIDLDPVEVRKRWQTDRETFPGEFDEERQRVERSMTDQVVSDVLSAAHQAVQREVLSATSKLEDDGPYKVLPGDWEEIRPRLSDIAPVVVEHVRESTKDLAALGGGEGITIPLPEVTVRAADYRTQSELSSLPGIGRSSAQIGPRTIPFPQVALNVRELGAEDDVLPVQVEVPITGVRLDDRAGNRYYATILDARPESPPDSVDEIREQVTQDFREIEAFKLLEARVDEFRRVALGEGLEGIENLFPAPEPEDPEAPRSAGGPVVRRSQVQVGAEGTSPGYPELNNEPVREAVLTIAEDLDPLTPIEEVPIAERTAVVPVATQRGVVAAQLVGLRPLTRQLYRTVAQTDVQEAINAEFRELAGDRARLPYTYDRLVERFDFRLVGRAARDAAEERRREQALEDAGEQSEGS